MQCIKSVLILMLISLSLFALAQINESDTFKFQLRTAVTGNYQKGNVEVLTVKSRLDFSYSSLKDVVFKSQNSSLYQAFYSKKADNDIFSRNYFYYKPQHTIYPFSIAYISTNYRRKIDTRLFAGAGATVQVLNKKNHTIKLSASAIYETTKFSATQYNYSKYNGSNMIDLWRGTLYLGGWDYLLNNHVRLYYDAFWQPALNDKHNYRRSLI